MNNRVTTEELGERENMLPHVFLPFLLLQGPPRLKRYFAIRT